MSFNHEKISQIGENLGKEKQNECEKFAWGYNPIKNNTIMSIMKCNLKTF